MWRAVLALSIAAGCRRASTTMPTDSRNAGIRANDAGAGDAPTLGERWPDPRPDAGPSSHSREACRPGLSPRRPPGSELLPNYPVIPPEPPRPVRPFDRAATTTALASIASQVQSCASADGPRGKGRVCVAFDPSGAALSTRVEGAPFEDTAVGDCVAARFMAARIPPFGGDTVVAHKTFQIE